MSVSTEGTALVQVRGSRVYLDLEIDSTEVALRQERSLEITTRDPRALGELLRIPALDYRFIKELPASTQAVLARLPYCVEFTDDERVRRLVSPLAHVNMVTLPAKRWHSGLQEIFRFTPYSACKILLESAPHDLDELCLEAAYWGVGVQIGEFLIIEPENFSPTRYSGASWLFAEQAARATRLT